jgi:hypothetical protein
LNKLAIGNNLFRNLTITVKNKNLESYLIVASPPYFSDLLDLTFRLSQIYSSAKLIFKLHPLQGIHDFDTAVSFFTNSPNVEVVLNGRSTAVIMGEVCNLVAIQSTVVYEALQVGLKVFLYARQDYDSHDDIFENRNVFIIEDEMGVLENSQCGASNTDGCVFFKEFDKKMFGDFLSGSIG